MTRWIVFLRGVNVGGNNILPMKALRSALEAAGFTAVQTYIQSGNIVLDAPFASAEETGAAVTGLIEQEFGFAPRSHVLSADCLARAIEANPFAAFGADDPKTVHFFFLAEAPGQKADLDAVESLKAANEQTALTGQVFYLFAPDGIGRSKLADRIGKCIPVPMTARNMRSVYKVAELAGLTVKLN